MSVTMRKAVSVLTAVVLVTAVAMATATPAVGAPKSGPDFTIKAHIEDSMGGDRSFRSWGDITDQGAVWQDAYVDETGQHVYELYFLSEQGSITILVPIESTSP